LDHRGYPVVKQSRDITILSLTSIEPDDLFGQRNPAVTGT
jgi:hypothetical protein